MGSRCSCSSSSPLPGLSFLTCQVGVPVALCRSCDAPENITCRLPLLACPSSNRFIVQITHPTVISSLKETATAPSRVSRFGARQPRAGGGAMVCWGTSSWRKRTARCAGICTTQETPPGLTSKLPLKAGWRGGGCSHSVRQDSKPSNGASCNISLQR